MGNGEKNVIVFLRQHLMAAIFVGVIFAAAVFVYTFSFGRGYVAQSDFLIVQANAEDKDFYTLFKSSEYLGKVLGEAIGSERFIQAAIETGKMQESLFPVGKSERIRAWKKAVSVNRNAEFGMLSVRVQMENERDAAKTMQAVSEVLVEKNALFRSGDEKSVEVRLLSGPIVKQTPDTAQMIFIVLFGFVFGVALSFARTFWKETKRDQEFDTVLNQAYTQ